MLTIGQLARFAGCTVKAVRVYHAHGLLPEPQRDASGYRRYDAQAVIDLTRIVTLAKSGVPLAEIPALLRADEKGHAASIARIDRELQERITGLERRRAQLAVLDRPDRLCLTSAAVAHLELMRELGFSGRYLVIERDTLILASALMQGSVERYLPERITHLDDAEYLELAREYDRALDWDAGDPRIEEVAQRTVAVSRRMFPDLGTPIELAPGVEAIVNDFQSDTAAWVALRDRVEELLRPPSASQPRF